jgi:hypothetical protein
VEELFKCVHELPNTPLKLREIGQTNKKAEILNKSEDHMRSHRTLSGDFRTFAG